jgi:alkylation response protein AidB-like acyl-CoA dehydrogenase
VPKSNLVGKINQGWTIAKRLLLYERAMMSDLQAFIPKPKYSFQKIALLCLEAATNPAEKTILRDKTASIAMDYQALKITSQRIFEEAKAGSPSPAAFILKYYGTETDKRRDELVMDLLGNSGNGWQGETFENYQLAATRQYLQSKGLSLGGGSSEIQLNIIAKNVLELPD